LNFWNIIFDHVAEEAVVTVIAKEPSDSSCIVIVVNGQMSSGTNVLRSTFAYKTAASLFAKDTVVLILG
jgi:hypothetical protein